MKQTIRTAEEIVQAQLDAYNARDIDAFVQTYSQQVQILEHPTGNLIMQGRDELREVYTQLFAENPQMHAEVLNRTVFGKFVVDLEYLTGRVNREPFQALAMYEVEDEQITRVWFVG